MIACNVIPTQTRPVFRRSVSHATRLIIITLPTPVTLLPIYPQIVWNATPPCLDGRLRNLIIPFSHSPLVMPLLTAINVMIRPTIPQCRQSVSPVMRPITMPPPIPTTSRLELTMFAWNATLRCRDGSPPNLNISISHSPLVMPLLTAINVMIRSTIPQCRQSVSPAMRRITMPPPIPTTSQLGLTMFAWSVTLRCRDGLLLFMVTLASH